MFYDINELKAEECVLKGNNSYPDGIISLEWIDDLRVVTEFTDKALPTTQGALKHMLCCKLDGLLQALS